MICACGEIWSSAKNAFLIGGITGTFLEQTDAVLLPTNIFAWPYVFLVYGSFKAFGVFLAEGELGVANRKSTSHAEKVIPGLTSEFTATILAMLFISALENLIS